jgi:hypothetical protein
MTQVTKLPAPAHLCTTFQYLHDAGACVDGYAKLANHIRDQLAVTPKDYGMDRPIAVATILESNGPADARWVIRNASLGEQTDADNFLCLLACDCAEHVLPIFEKHHPDDKRVRLCIEVTRKYCKGECTAQDMVMAQRGAFAARNEAWHAASASVYAASASVYAASAAAASAAAAAASADAYAYADASAAYAARKTEQQWQLDAFRAALVVATPPSSEEVATEEAPV